MFEVCVGVDGGVARQREDPSALQSPPPLTSSMICSHVSGRLAGFAVTCRGFQ